MSLVSFDSFDLYEKPLLVLCKPSMEQQYILGNIINLKYSPRFNALSELSFTAFEYINGDDSDGTQMPYYPYLVNRKLVYVEEFGYFQITKNEEHGDGKKKYKDITCQSLEVQLVMRPLGVLKGTYKLYDPITPAGTLLQRIVDNLPDWSILNVDASIAVKYRTFDITDSTVYKFLMTDVEEAYECVFEFDTVNKTISAYDRATATTNTDIYMSYQNLIKNIKLEEIYDEMVTSLEVSGAGDLSINQVNPLGNDKIYNFTHYKSTEWMSQDLMDAITAWEVLVTANQPVYASTLTDLLDNNEILINLNGELVTLQGELSALDNVKIVKIQGGLSLTSINAEIVAKQLEITNKNAEIVGVEATITTLINQLTAINTLISFEENFTIAQIEELQPYIVQSSYTNENFIQTSTMSNVEIQEQAQALYDQAVGILARISEPRYNFDVNSVTFPLIKDFLIFTNQLVLGAVINLEIKPDVISYPVLLGFDLEYDNPENFKLIFGNRLRLDNSAFQYSDLMNSAISSATTTRLSSQGWSTSASYVNNTVNTFINSALDAAVNNVVSGSAQNMTLTAAGLRGRQMLPDGTYDPKQLWMVNNMLAFSDDGFDTAKLALGEISLPGGGTGFGVVGSYLIGNVIAGNSLTITNDNSTFLLDGAGATLTNATLSVQNLTNKIFLDPINGLKIQSTSGGVTTDRFYADTSGNLHISGILDAASGNFSGTLTAPTINGGTINGTTGNFSGNIYAANLQGAVVDSQIQSVSANKITAGTISAVTITGANIIGSTFSGGSINGDITAGTLLAAFIRGAEIHTNALVADGGNPMTAYGSFYANGGYVATQSWSNSTFAYKWTGRSTSVRVYDYNSSGQRTLTFNNGILTSG